MRGTQSVRGALCAPEWRAAITRAYVSIDLPRRFQACNDFIRGTGDRNWRSAGYGVGVGRYKYINIYMDMGNAYRSRRSASYESRRSATRACRAWMTRGVSVYVQRRLSTSCNSNRKPLGALLSYDSFSPASLAFAASRSLAPHVHRARMQASPLHSRHSPSVTDGMRVGGTCCSRKILMFTSERFCLVFAPRCLARSLCMRFSFSLSLSLSRDQ